MTDFEVLSIIFCNVLLFTFISTTLLITISLIEDELEETNEERKLRDESRKILEIDEPELRNALQILILSYIEAENELQLQYDNGDVLFERIRENWGQKLKAWLPEA